MAEIHVDGDSLSIELTVLEQFLAVHGSLRIPLQHITGVEVADENGWSFAWRKLIGTSAPGLKMAGTFFSGDGWVFCDFGNGKSCLQIDVAHETYKRIIVQLSDLVDPNRVATDI